MKVEKGEELITILSDDSNGDSSAIVPPDRSPLVNNTFQNSVERTTTLISHPPSHVSHQLLLSVVDYLMKL
jgi:hypothetical protein